MRHNAADDEVTRAHVRNRAALGRTPLRHQLRRSGSGPDERDYAAAGDQARPGDRAAVEIHTARGKTPLKRTGELLLKLDKSRGGGPGYGLYLAKRVIEGQGGSITVESGPGEGSSFCLMIPR